ncbi:MAG: hypothetical protein ACLT46_15810, partial [Hungatella sp.]
MAKNLLYEPTRNVRLTPNVPGRFFVSGYTAAMSHPRRIQDNLFLLKKNLSCGILRLRRVASAISFH